MYLHNSAVGNRKSGIHASVSKNDDEVYTAIDQCAATGYEADTKFWKSFEYGRLISS